MMNRVKLLLIGFGVFIFMALATCFGFYFASKWCGQFPLNKWVSIKARYESESYCKLPGYQCQLILPKKVLAAKIRFTKQGADLIIACDIKEQLKEKFDKSTEIGCKIPIKAEGEKENRPDLYYKINNVNFSFLDSDDYLIYTVKSDDNDIKSINDNSHLFQKAGNLVLIKKILHKPIPVNIIKITRKILYDIVYQKV